MAERIDMEHDQGATFARRFIWKTDTATPVPIDVSSYTARMHLRSSVDAAFTILELTTENGRIALGGDNGYVDLLIEAEDTTLIAPGTYRYDLELVAADGFVTRLAEGKIKFRPEVTR
jgi:hypothetical protein